MTRNLSVRLTRALGFSLLSSLVAVGAEPRSGSQQPAHESGTPPAGAGLELAIPDVPVLTQDGERVRFRTDLVEKRVVAINFIFTTCTTICPPLGVTFRKVQTLLGERLGRDVQLISVSVDPVTDTPERLKAWGRKFGAGPGWTLVTGRKEDMDQLLKALNAFTATPEDHSPMVLIGGGPRQVWSRSYGLAPAATLVKAIEDAIASAEPEAAPRREGLR